MSLVSLWCLTLIYVAKHFLNSIFDFIRPVSPEQILRGNRLFWPFLKYQHEWIAYHYPGDKIVPTVSTWSYLQKYVMPLIQLHASSYHLAGIRCLHLDTESKPNFTDFCRLFSDVSGDFSIEPVDKEIDARDYFSLIKQQKFPCIERMRAYDEIFCANEPDFWHEAIGHLTALCFPDVQNFYYELADYVLSASNKTLYKNRLAVAWTLMEYGFIKQQNQPKMFGAALVGSHLANMRYLKGYVALEPAYSKAIIHSDFYKGNLPPKNDAGLIRFFCLNNLTIRSVDFTL